MTINWYPMFFIVSIFISHTGIAQKEFKQDTSRTSITKKSKVALLNNQLKIEEGKCTVFNIQLSNGGDKRVDAGMDKGLIFEIPKGQQTFEIKDWNKNKSYIQISGCRCLNIGFNLVTEGVITGKKLQDDSWQITADVSSAGSEIQEQPVHFIFNGIVK